MCWEAGPAQHAAAPLPRTALVHAGPATDLWEGGVVPSESGGARAPPAASQQLVGGVNPQPILPTGGWGLQLIAPAALPEVPAALHPVPVLPGQCTSTPTCPLPNA